MGTQLHDSFPPCPSQTLSPRGSRSLQRDRRTPAMQAWGRLACLPQRSGQSRNSPRGGLWPCRNSGRLIQPCLQAATSTALHWEPPALSHHRGNKPPTPHWHPTVLQEGWAPPFSLLQHQGCLPAQGLLAGSPRRRGARSDVSSPLCRSWACGQHRRSATWRQARPVCGTLGCPPPKLSPCCSPGRSAASPGLCWGTSAAQGALLSEPGAAVGQSRWGGVGAN